MNRGRIKLFSLAAMITLLAACSKTDNSGFTLSPNDITPPVLDIFTPAANQVFTSGTTISVTGRVTDDLGLYRGSIRIVNDANGNILKEQLFEIHYILLYNFNISYTATVTTASDYTVTVSFEDHGLNSTTKSVKVKVNP